MTHHANTPTIDTRSPHRGQLRIQPPLRIAAQAARPRQARPTGLPPRRPMTVHPSSSGQAAAICDLGLAA
jgi:hypothetical protein